MYVPPLKWANPKGCEAGFKLKKFVLEVTKLFTVWLKELSDRLVKLADYQVYLDAAKLYSCVFTHCPWSALGSAASCVVVTDPWQPVKLRTATSDRDHHQKLHWCTTNHSSIIDQPSVNESFINHRFAIKNNYEVHQMTAINSPFTTHHWPTNSLVAIISRSSNDQRPLTNHQLTIHHSYHRASTYQMLRRFRS